MIEANKCECYPKDDDGSDGGVWFTLEVINIPYYKTMSNPNTTDFKKVKKIVEETVCIKDLAKVKFKFFQKPLAYLKTRDNPTLTKKVAFVFQMDRVILKIPFVFKRGYVRTHVISVTKGPSWEENKNLTTFYDAELAKHAANGTNYTSIHEAPLQGRAVIDMGITQVCCINDFDT